MTEDDEEKEKEEEEEDEEEDVRMLSLTLSSFSPHECKLVVFLNPHIIGEYFYFMYLFCCDNAHQSTVSQRG